MCVPGLLGFAMHSDGTGHDDLYLPFDQTKDEGPNPSVKDGERGHSSAKNNKDTRNRLGCGKREGQKEKGDGGWR
jgi:hypothetical protein